MPNIASVLKSEIARVARKEVRSDTLNLKRAASAHRADIAALKRRVQALEQQLGRFLRESSKDTSAGSNADVALRFSAKGFASQRRKLGLSAADCGLLLDASAQTVYNWELGKARPRTQHLSAIAAFRTMGKRAAVARLATLKGAK